MNKVDFSFLPLDGLFFSPAFHHSEGVAQSGKPCGQGDGASFGWWVGVRQRRSGWGQLLVLEVLEETLTWRRSQLPSWRWDFMVFEESISAMGFGDALLLEGYAGCWLYERRPHVYWVCLLMVVPMIEAWGSLWALVYGHTGRGPD